MDVMKGDQGRGIGFNRDRRITGYVVPLDRWNDAKRAEEKDRLKHTGLGSYNNDKQEDGSED